MVIHLSSFTVQPSVFSATGLLRLQACTVPVWSVKSTSRSKPVVAEKTWSLPGQNWLVQLCMSSVAWNLHLELRQERKQTEGLLIKHVFNSARSNDWSKTPGSWGLDCLMNLLCVLAWTHQRFLMTFETEESRSSLEMKLYVMPKKASGLSWAFSFSWLTVYTSVMESTAETKTAPQIHVCILFFVSVENRLRVTLSSDLLMCYCGDILSLFIVNKPHGNDDIWFIYLC